MALWEIQPAAACCVAGVVCGLLNAEENTRDRLRIEIITAARGSADWDWTHERTAFVPGGDPLWITTMSHTERTGSHAYHDVFAIASRDRGATWTGSRRDPFAS